ncbi:MAG: STAS/SEC14 domain-containing protein [Bacteroidia bacterium]|nr:STAS/SEC14 domain-containing protein [Bacteroidia bacterium]
MNTNFKVLESFKHGIAQVECWDNGIIYFKTDDYSETQLEDSVFQYEYLKSKFDGKNKLKILVEPGKFSTITKEAREFSTKPETNKMTMASAVVVSSLAQRLLISFIINLTQKQNMKMKIFETKQKALEWLLSI